MAGNHLLSISTISEFFKNSIKQQKRGEIAYKDNHVLKFQADMNLQIITVQLNLKDGCLSDAQCFCPRRIVCYHIATLALHTHYNISSTDTLLPNSLYKSLNNDTNLNGVHAIQWSITNESCGINILKQEETVSVISIGLWLSNNGFHEASPDENDHILINKQHPYWDQIQGQLYTNRKFCYLVIWTPMQSIITKVQKDNKWKSNLGILEAFFILYYLFFSLNGILLMHFLNNISCKILIHVITIFVIVALLQLNLTARSKCGKLCLNFIKTTLNDIQYLMVLLNYKALETLSLKVSSDVYQTDGGGSLIHFFLPSTNTLSILTIFFLSNLLESHRICNSLFHCNGNIQKPSTKPQFLHFQNMHILSRLY
ncbi:hypothetical protein QTP88_019476 [Uroleucon formosanum]